MATKLLLTGATGMVGEGVLHECLQDAAVDEVLVLGRKSCGVVHPKMKELLHGDFFDLAPIEQELSGYNGCLFCLGVSSVGMNEADYTKATYTLTMHVATTLARLNTDMTFCYISGAGTDSTEKGRSMWARVKGKTEDDLTKLSFKAVYNFRPGILAPTKGLKNTLKFYKYFRWLIPAINALFPKFISTLAELGRAMIHACIKGYSKTILEVTDIKVLARQ